MRKLNAEIIYFIFLKKNFMLVFIYIFKIISGNISIHFGNDAAITLHELLKSNKI